MNPIPAHVAIIMDGNGRWAVQRGLPRIDGHGAGVETCDRIVTESSAMGIRYLTLYAFSDENWSRPVEEISALMDLLGQYLVRKTPKMIANRIRFETIGEIDRLPPSVQSTLQATKDATAAGTGMTLIMALSYGARSEICRAVSRLLAEGAREATQETIGARLDTAAYPDPDLLIRTSGEYRISNFLLWQAAYTELYFTETLWPDFSPSELRAAVEVYRKRERRFGGVR
ncbi:MAG: di-trans,poly-cis-decaprenylcistransferase [Deltaproteobacteria bacterium]|nr:di-trans,poly-cis-decaprenylcistransferase [Deltaproteobacteria bacterium]